MNGYPIAQVVVFVALAAAGIILSVAAPGLVAAADAPAVTAIGAATFGGSLAFFLTEMFHWERARAGA